MNVQKKKDDDDEEDLNDTNYDEVHWQIIQHPPDSSQKTSVSPHGGN